MTATENILLDPDPSELLGVKRRKGFGTGALERLLRRDPCSYCGAPSIMDEHQVDHIHARSLGGPDKWWNYTAACRLCNEIKGAESPLLWLAVLAEVRDAHGDERLPAVIIDLFGRRFGG